MNRIFLIDDDLDDQLFFKDAIELIDPALEIDSALNGRIALDKLMSSTILPDLIFLDLNMPIMNGFEFLTQVKNEKHLSNIPIGIFTTSNIVDDIERTRQLGSRFFLTKPNDFNILCAQLHKLLNSDFSNDDFVNLK